jgi:hypothetical protein
MKRRTKLLFLLLPKVFLGGFFWEVFSIAATNRGCTSRSQEFYFLTGFGDGLGTFIGHIIVSLISCENKRNFLNVLVHALLSSLVVFFGIGTMWQFNVNTSHVLNHNFTQAFFYLVCISFFVHFLSLIFFRECIHQIATNAKVKSKTLKFKDLLWLDSQLSFSVAISSGFFMGTCATEFVDNWLSPLFGVNNSTSNVAAVVLSGCSTAVGFFIAQFIQNLFIKESWIDLQVEDEKSLDLLDTVFTDFNEPDSYFNNNNDNYRKLSNNNNSSHHSFNNNNINNSININNNKNNITILDSRIF